MSSSSDKTAKMVYVGPDEWHGPVYLEHGRIYDLSVRNGKKAVTVDIFGVGEHPKQVAYPHGKFEKYWRGI